MSSQHKTIKFYKFPVTKHIEEALGEPILSTKRCEGNFFFFKKKE